MKKHLAPVLVLILIVGVFATPAIAASPKAGAKCSTFGQSFVSSEMKFTCVKVGSKLVWSKGVKASSAAFKAPMPISLPVAQTGTITFATVLDHIPEIPQTAWQKVQDVIAVKSSNSTMTKTKFDINVGPNTPIDVTGGLPRVREVLTRTEKLWSGFSQSKNFYLLMYNAQDEPWAEKEWKTFGKSKKYISNFVKYFSKDIAANCQKQTSTGSEGNLTNCRGNNGGAIANSDDAYAFFGQGGQGASSDASVVGGGMAGRLYTGSVQDSQWNGKPSTYCNEKTYSGNCWRSSQKVSFAPCWLAIGQPSSVGQMAVAENYDSYSTFHKDLPFNQGATTITDYSQSSLRDYLYNQSPKTCYQNESISALGFSVGALATEVLTAIAGPQATMALFSLGAQGQNFPTAFKNVYGISWSDASVILSKVLAAEYATYGPYPG